MIRRSFRRTLARWLAGCALVLLVWPPQPVHARGDDPAVVRKAEAVATEAKLLFQQKAYEAAAERFMEAYTMVHRASLIFNAARAYQEAGAVRKATALFKAYTALPDATPDGKIDAAQRIEKIDADLRSQEAKPADAVGSAAEPVHHPTDPATKAHATLPGPATATVGGGHETQSLETAGQVTQSAPAMRRFPWSASAAVGALAASSGLLYGLALSDAVAAHDMEATLHTTAEGQRYQQHVAKAEVFRNAAVVTGTLAVVAAAWLGWELWGPQDGGKGDRQDEGNRHSRSSSYLMALPTSGGALASWTTAW